MRIRKVKWDNHPILKDLELSFVKNDNTAYESIIIAGENGVGKTSILQTISTFLNKGTFEFFDFIEYEVDGKIYLALPTTGDRKSFFRIKDDDEIINVNTDKNHLNATIDNDSKNIRFHGSVFSKARADFKTEKISHTTTKELDTDKYDIDESDNFTQLKQLIVDIENQDNSEYSNLNRNLGPNPKTWDDFYNTSKMFRFTNAFNNFFDYLKYEKVSDINGEKTILFKKGAASINIDNLSTGEKQIVFRGSYLLKNINKLEGAIIMIDEPEISMHPKWQRKILNYYKTLFTNDSGSLISQLFFSTHSEHVINNALQDKNENIVIVINSSGSHKIDAPSVLPSITFAETNYLAFGIESNDYHIELYGFYQHKNSLTTIKDTDNKILTEIEYDASKHQKIYPHPNGRTTYETLPTYIRNVIDHPDGIHFYSEEELGESIKFLIKVCS
ncbi:AAA family ATPase [Chryseobacterium manosquense]|uniref:AAA family ATPase n=1 Tax=Chryseobacterium manosquense TaxID=2754694 RepID=A0A7H1E027_9FLAO|nr:ATP-binding protein [Chryseobacterium manosquense]QNS42585.1 AAA family ATPase [Chryseobacterium manosquense]ROI02379.1 hypothetical protein EGH90_12770 [Kaistella haifensis]